MFRITTRGLGAHRFRLALAVISIALGVAFAVGTLVLSDTLGAGFERAYSNQYAGIDVVIRSHAAFTSASAADQRRPIPATLLGAVHAVPGVGDAAGRVTGFALLTDSSGHPLGKGAVANLGGSVPAQTRLAGAISWSAGRAPSSAAEVALDAASATSGGHRVGDTMRVVFAGGSQLFRIVGVARFGGEPSLGGATSALFDTATAQRVLGRDGAFDEIVVSAAPGVAAGELLRRVGGVLPVGVEAVDGARAAEESAAVVGGNLDSINQFLLVFTLVAVLVGSLIIRNTFAMLAAQRRRDTALLRAVGATSRQVVGAVVAEALGLGALGAVAGIGVGLAMARGLVWLFGVVGLQMPQAAPQLTGRTVAVAVLIGVGVSLVAAVGPARAASRISPVEALRSSSEGDDRLARRRVWLQSGCAAAGLALLVDGLVQAESARIALGAVLGLQSLVALLPVVTRPLARVLGMPGAKVGRMAGRLAQVNAMRNPRRTAATASALLVGIATVVGVAVLGASLKASTSGAIEADLNADLVVQQLGGSGTGLSAAVAIRLRANPDVAAAVELASATVKVDGALASVAVAGSQLGTVANLGLRTGTPDALARGEVLLADSVAEAHHWVLGSVVHFAWGQGGTASLTVGGIFREKTIITSGYVMSPETFDRYAGGRLDSLVFLKARTGVSTQALQGAVRGAVADFPNAEALTRSQFITSIAGSVDQLLIMAMALLLLAVLVAVLGIVNTMALSAIERTREIGLLRAVGMTRRQVRSMVRGESVIIAVIGAGVGGLLGIGLGAVLTRALTSWNIHTVAVPYEQVAIFVVIASLVGVVAAIGPARRSAKVDILRAVTTE